MKSFRISQSYDFAYDAPCIRRNRSCLRYPMRFHMLPRACPGQFKCSPECPVTAKKIWFRSLPCSNQMQLLLVPYVFLSSLASKSGCSGLIIHVRHRGHRFRIPPSPPFPASGASSSASSPAGARRSDFGAAAYHSTSLCWRYAVYQRCPSEDRGSLVNHKAVGTIRACVLPPVEKATCGYAVRCIHNIDKVQGCHT